MASRAVRIPEETYTPLRTLAALSGSTPGSVLEAAFAEYLSNHREEFAETFLRAQKLIASRDIEGLLALTSDDRRERARRAAIAMRSRGQNPS